jgi:SAM-dependent methyltransferase
MNLREIVNRNMDLQPWVEGERVPWDEAAFSERVLKEHLTQENEAASRPVVKIEKQIGWLHQTILAEKPSRILDLGCGPGLYTTRLAELGHTCLGIDCAPASIAYALENAPKGCSYRLGDLRSADYGNDYDLIILIFGALNLFRPPDAHLILEKACAALKPGGRLLLEISSLDAVDQIGNQPSMWYSAEAGLFSDKPHVCLMETFWDEEQNVATERFFILDAATGQVTRQAASTQGYEEGQIESLLREAGFGEAAFSPSLTGKAESDLDEFMVVLAQKPV